MTFSIITPSFNQGRFIRNCIESVKVQSGVEWEHIVVDAGSTDETVGILKASPHLQWISEPDQGMSDGINKGFLRATGDWVMWLNGDDYLMPGALSKVAEFASKNLQADLIYGDCVFVEASKKVSRRKHEHPFDFSILLFYGCYIPSTSTFIRRSVITNGELLNMEYRVCMDFEYYVRLSERGYQFKYLPEPLACFRWHPANTSTVQATRRYKERLQIQQEYLRRNGRKFLASEKLLSVLRRVFQAKRVLLRLFSR